MKIECAHSVILDAFSLAASAAPRNSPKEVLNNVKIVASGGAMVLHAGDTEVGIQTTVTDVDVKSDGAILLPVIRTAGILREWSEETVSIETATSAGGGPHLLIKGSRSKYKIPMANPDEFPTMADFKNEAYIKLDARALHTGLKRTVYAADVDSSRFALGGVKFDSSENGIELIGTDGRRLAHQSLVSQSVNDHVISDSVIVPTKGVQLIDRALPKEGMVHIQAGFNDIMACAGNSVICSRLVEGRYPNWRQVVPDAAGYNSVDIPVGSLFSAVRQASIVTDRESRGVDLTFASGSLTIEASTSDIGDSKVEVPVAYDDLVVKLTIDNRYAQDICKVLEPEAILTLQFRDGRSAMLVTTGDDYECVIMPLTRE